MGGVVGKGSLRVMMFRSGIWGVAYKNAFNLKVIHVMFLMVGSPKYSRPV